jgi:hypothetical protein
VIYCAAAEREHQIAEDYLAEHIIDPTSGHVTIKISGHPPFGAQVILNGRLGGAKREHISVWAGCATFGGGDLRLRAGGVSG